VTIINTSVRDLGIAFVLALATSGCGGDQQSPSSSASESSISSSPNDTGSSLTTSAASGISEPSSPANLGPFKPSPAFSLYWLNRPANCTANLRLQTTTAGENIFVRAIDVSKGSTLSETMTYRQYLSLPSDTTQTIRLTLATTPSAITEIRVSVGSNKATVTLESSCAVPDYGVSYQNGDFTGWEGMPASLFAFVPFRAEMLNIQNEAASTISVMGVDASGARSDSTGPQEGPVTIAAASSTPVTVSLVPRFVSWQGTSVSNVIWKFSFPKDSWEFRAGGFPLILCSNETTANALAAGTFIRGSAVLSHVAQYDLISSVIPQLYSMSGVTAQLQAMLPSTLEPALLESPNYFLASIYGPIYDLAYSLKSQDLIKDSNWVGSSDGWQFRDPLSPTYAGARFMRPTSPTVSYEVSHAQVASTRTMPLLDATISTRLGPVDAISVSPIETAPLMQMGTSDDDGTATQGLAMLAVLDGAQSPAPFNNPYYRSKPLLYRAALAALRDLTNLQEDEIWHYNMSGMTDLDSYPGGEPAFLSARKIFPNYGIVGLFMRRLFCASDPSSSESALYNCPSLPTPMSAVERSAWDFSAAEIALWKQTYLDWTNLLHRYAYRMYPNDLVTTRNQSAHYLVAFQMLADGSGDPFDVELSKQYAARWIAGQDPAGWSMESAGPDGSYAGIQDYEVASYYLDTCRMDDCNSSIAASLAKNYSFFSYTVAPEPTTDASAIPKMLGGFPFNHRVGSPFSLEQFNGARGIANDIPEVSAWNQSLLSSSAPSALPASINPDEDAHLDFNSNRYFGTINRPQASPAPWPASSAADFTTDVNGAGEMIAVKRASYYAAFYIAHPAGSATDINGANNPNERLAWLSDTESRGCNIGNSHHWSTPFVGGGMTLFWTPDFGSSVVAGNWSPLAHHGLVLTDGSTGVRSWEDYFSVSYSMSDSNHLNTLGNIESMTSQLQPVVDDVVNPTPTGSSPCLVNSSGAGAKSNISGLSYTRDYVFAANDMVVTTTVSSTPSAIVPGRSTMIESIPIASGPIKNVSTGTPMLYLPGSLIPIANGTTVPDATEIDVYGANSAQGLRIRFKAGPSVKVVSNGPILTGSLQINRLEINFPIPSPGGSSKISYCLQRLSDNPQECGF